MRERFQNLPLMRKITLVICGMGVMLSGILVAIAMIYYLSISSERLHKNALLATKQAAESFNTSYTDIMERFVTICGTKEFAQEVRQINEMGVTYAAMEQQVQNELSDLGKCSYLVSGALLLSWDGRTIYTTYSNRIRTPVNQVVTRSELASAKGISLLVKRPSPFRSSVSVIPILIPLKMGRGELLKIGKEDTVPDAYVMILLDSAKLEQSLEMANVKTTASSYWLVDSQGNLISGDISQNIPHVLEKGGAKELIEAVVSGEVGQTRSGADAYLFARKLKVSDVYLVNYVKQETLLNIFGSTGWMLLVILAMVVVVVLAISYVLTGYMIRPLNRLSQVVQRIEEEDYTEKEHFDTTDEIGQLGTAVNQMYDTIQRQMVRIKEEESEKYRTELKLLTEQINPHFLYNTLECIQSEVLRGERETAAGMIQYLAEYLRIGLSYGADFIPITNELRHANAYVKLMNQRFGQSVLFMYQIPPGLSHKLVLKTILQPLMENSIKHGFGIDASGIPIMTPTIEVNLSVRGENLAIEVADNGSGFEVKHAQKIAFCESKEAARHVGLHNVWHRLVTVYGKENVQMNFTSIPYYRNTVELVIPLRENASPDTSS